MVYHIGVWLIIIKNMSHTPSGNYICSKNLQNIQISDQKSILTA